MPKTVLSDTPDDLEKTCGAGPRGPDSTPARGRHVRKTDLDKIPDDDIAEYGIASPRRRRKGK